MPPGHWPSCGKFPPAGEVQPVVAIKVEGCNGATRIGGVFFRVASTAIVTTIRIAKAMAQNAMQRADFGLPAIMTAIKMRIRPDPPTKILGLSLHKKSRHPIHLGCLGF